MFRSVRSCRERNDVIVLALIAIAALIVALVIDSINTWR
jgi:hypothetical protein